jgi:hypothetical protein
MVASKVVVSVLSSNPHPDRGEAKIGRDSQTAVLSFTDIPMGPVLEEIKIVLVARLHKPESPYDYG